jgi:hypothetical protein
MRTALLLTVLLVAPVSAADTLKPGKVELKSAGPLAFSPDGVLFVGDPSAAAVYAIGTNDTKATDVSPVLIEKLDGKLAAMLGVTPADIKVNDLVVNPASHAIYMSVSRGKAAPVPVIIKAVGDKLTEVALDNVPNAKAELTKLPDGDRRRMAITGMKFSGGKLYVAGLSNEEFASTLRTISYPFDGKATAAGIQIYHGAHGKYETASPVRTFTPIQVNGKEEILAAYTCTPLVRIPTSELTDGAKVKGTTVAELGNRNNPLDMVPYTKDGKPFVLMANTTRGVMKVNLDNIATVDAISTRISDKAGLSYETLGDLKGVEQIDKLGDGHVVLLVKGPDGLGVRTIPLP